MRFGEDPPAGCGARYAYLVQAGGYGPDNPTGFKPWVSSADVNAWLGTAQSIFDLVRVRWNALIQAENAKTDLPFEQRHAPSSKITAYVTGYENEFASLPQPRWFDVAGQNAELQRVIRNCQAGACALELLDAALSEAGGAAVPVPFSPPPNAPPWAGIGEGILPIAVIAVLAVMMLGQDQRRARR